MDIVHAIYRLSLHKILIHPIGPPNNKQIVSLINIPQKMHLLGIKMRQFRIDTHMPSRHPSDKDLLRLPTQQSKVGHTSSLSLSLSLGLSLSV